MKILLKIAPIVALLACAVALYLATELKTQKTGLLSDKAQLTADVSQTRAKLDGVRADLKQTQDELQQSKNQTLEAKAELDAAKVTIGQKDAAIAEHQTKLGELGNQLADAKSQVAAAEKATAELKQKLGSLDLVSIEDLNKKLEGLQGENKLLGEKTAALETEKQKLLKEIEDLKFTPADTRGKVALARSMWNFVVLDIGVENKVRPNAEFLVYRDERLIAKTRVTTVYPNTAVAELVPGFTTTEPREGDIVIAQAPAKPAK